MNSTSCVYRQSKMQKKKCAAPDQVSIPKTLPLFLRIWQCLPARLSLVEISCLHCSFSLEQIGARCSFCYHHHQSLNREGCWGTTDDFATSFLHFSLFSAALWDLPNSRPVHSLMLSSHLFLCPPCLLPPFTVPCKMVLARPDERPDRMKIKGYCLPTSCKKHTGTGSSSPKSWCS